MFKTLATAAIALGVLAPSAQAIEINPFNPDFFLYPDYIQRSEASLTATCDRSGSLLVKSTTKCFGTVKANVYNPTDDIVKVKLVVEGRNYYRDVIPGYRSVVFHNMRFDPGYNDLKITTREEAQISNFSVSNGYVGQLSYR